MIIGLTGLYCAGKNHVSLLLEKRGIPVLDADKIGHEIIRLETEKIKSRFGKEILNADGSLDRRLLGKRIFGRPEELAALEAIIHPGVNRRVEEWLKEKESLAGQSGLCVINAALLHKASVCGRLKAVIMVKCPLPVRFFRAIRRDRLPLKELFNRILSQREFPCCSAKDRRAQLFFGSADIYTIRNSGLIGSQKALESRINAILEGWRYGKYGKEKITDGGGFAGSGSGNRGERRDSVL
jgi:dephospho-CoA kinase